MAFKEIVMLNFTHEELKNEDDEANDWEEVEELENLEEEAKLIEVALMNSADAETLLFFEENSFTHNEKIRFLEVQAKERVLKIKQLLESL